MHVVGFRVGGAEGVWCGRAVRAVCGVVCGLWSVVLMCGLRERVEGPVIFRPPCMVLYVLWAKPMCMTPRRRQAQISELAERQHPGRRERAK